MGVDPLFRATKPPDFAHNKLFSDSVMGVYESNGSGHFLTVKEEKYSSASIRHSVRAKSR